MMKSGYTALLIFFLAFPTKEIFGQNGANDNEKYSWFDGVIGQTNSGIFKGVVYVNQFRVVNERHQFFKTSDFTLGSLVYKGQHYFDMRIKYDVYMDNLLVENYALDNRPIMVFDEKSVSQFTIDEYSFEYISLDKSEGALSGFFEVLMKNDSLKLFKKHNKKIFKRTDKKNVYYEFKDSYDYILFINGRYYPFKKVKELNGIFPTTKKELNTLQKKHSSLKKSGDNYIKEILTDLLLLKAMPKLKVL